MTQVGLGPQASLMSQQTTLPSGSLIGPQQQSQLNPSLPPMSSAPPTMPSLATMQQIGMQPQKNAQQARQMNSHSLGAGALSRGGPIPSSQPAQSFMNQVKKRTVIF